MARLWHFGVITSNSFFFSILERERFIQSDEFQLVSAWSEPSQTRADLGSTPRVGHFLTQIRRNKKNNAMHDAVTPSLSRVKQIVNKARARVWPRVCLLCVIFCAKATRESRNGRQPEPKLLMSAEGALTRPGLSLFHQQSGGNGDGHTTCYPSWYELAYNPSDVGDVGVRVSRAWALQWSLFCLSCMWMCRLNWEWMLS